MNARATSLCYLTDLFMQKRCLILRGDYKISVLENPTKIIGKHVCNFISK